jgi:hypothetical protein
MHGFIGDTPARDKATNTIAFNGKFGCMHCLHPTVYRDHKTIYPMMENIQLRTNKRYIEQVTEAENIKGCFKGIKGFSYLSTWIEFPNNIIIDYMHLSLQGAFKAICNMFFNSENHSLGFYLGRRIIIIDKKLLSIRLPIEIARSTRSINERVHYKANEWRTILFYLSVPLFKGILPESYFKNLIKYVIFIRLLCQEAITKEEIDDSQKLIISFCKEFQKLYGESYMSFNLHAHLHLPDQVRNYGPLNKTSCFPFENMFFISQDNFHGNFIADLFNSKS